jgi:hypothetical protein
MLARGDPMLTHSYMRFMRFGYPEREVSKSYRRSDNETYQSDVDRSGVGSARRMCGVPVDSGYYGQPYYGPGPLITFHLTMARPLNRNLWRKSWLLPIRRPA